MFLLPGYAIVYHVTGTPIPEPNRLEIIRYLSNMQSADGGCVIEYESLSGRSLSVKVRQPQYVHHAIQWGKSVREGQATTMHAVVTPLGEGRRDSGLRVRLHDLVSRVCGSGLARPRLTSWPLPSLAGSC